MDETLRFRSDREKWYFHLTYNPVGHSKSKRVTVEDPDESYVLGTRQRLLASPLFKQQGSAQDLPSAAPPPPTPTTQPDHTPTTSMTSTLCRAVKVKLTYRASDTRGGSRPGAGRRSLLGTQPVANHDAARKAAYLERLNAEGFTHKAGETKKRVAQTVSDWEAYYVMSKNQFERLQKALTDPETTLDLLVPEERKEMEFLSFAKSTALTKRIICVMNFYKAVVTTSAPAYWTYLATQAKEWSNNIVSISTILRWEREYRQCQNHICLYFRGRWNRSFLLDEPEIRIKVMGWIHKKCDKDGEPGITNFL